MIGVGGLQPVDAQAADFVQFRFGQFTIRPALLTVSEYYDSAAFVSHGDALLQRRRPIVADDCRGDERCDPLAVLHAMANDFSRRPDGLRAEQIITTGTATPATQIQPGQTAVARFAGIGDVVAALV